MPIPRFNAQIGQVQIPSMNNYQEEQNASIAKSLAKFGSDLLGTTIKAYQEHENKMKKHLASLIEYRGYAEKNGAPKEYLDYLDQQIIRFGGKA